MNEEELLEFKKKNITDEVIMNLEASLHLNMKIVADEDKKQEFKEYQMAVYFLREQRDNLQQELQRKDNIINELEKCMKDLLNEANDKTSDLFIYEQNKAIINMFLDKINELEGDKK